MFMAAKKTNELNPQDLGTYPNYFFVYYNLLAVNGMLGIFVHMLFFYQNKDLREAFLETIKDIFLEFKEKFPKLRH